jgi:hypothetical protein
LVAKTAAGMAHELYDLFMHDNAKWSRWKAMWPDLGPAQLEKIFVSKVGPQLLPAARKALAAMLTQPGSEAWKDEISTALILDASLLRGRQS